MDFTIAASIPDEVKRENKTLSDDIRDIMEQIRKDKIENIIQVNLPMPFMKTRCGHSLKFFVNHFI